MTRPDYDYEAAATLRRRCGHDCGCEFASHGDLCSTGEDKAERMRDER